MRSGTKTTTKVHVNLRDAWEKAGKPTLYRINLDTHVSRVTIEKYIQEGGVVLSGIPNAVFLLADYFEESWQDCIRVYEAEVS